MNRNPTKSLSRYKALTFDCYGTLIDWETGIWDAFQPLIMSNAHSGQGRTNLLEAFAVFESQAESESPGLDYPAILQTVHRQVASHLGLNSTAQLDADFGNSVPHWPAFADTAEALRFLKRHFRLIILSNINRGGFAASQRKLGVEFDAVYTAEDIGSYKPDPANFEYMLTRLREDFGFEKADILHTAQSLFHDHAPAQRLGLSTAWIDRQGLSDHGEWGATGKLDEIPPTNFLFHSMAEMAAAVAADTGTSG